MSIDSNDHKSAPAPQAGAQNRQQTVGTDFGTFASAPSGSGADDILSMVTGISLERFDANVEPYLKTVLDEVQKRFPTCKVNRIQKMAQGYAFEYPSEDGFVNFFGIVFISTNDPVAPNYAPPSRSINTLRSELARIHADRKIRIVSTRLILSNYDDEMARTYEMARCIVSSFNVVSDPKYRDMSIAPIESAEYIVDWSLASARMEEASLSPHAVRPRMDVAATLKLKMPRDPDIRDAADEYRTLAVAGGYTEFSEREQLQTHMGPQLRYRPKFYITVLNAQIPHEGFGAIMLSILAPAILNEGRYLEQWADMTVEGKPNPGMLEVDADNPSQPLKLTSAYELQNFADSRFLPPLLILQLQEGRDAIPGMSNMISPDASDRATWLNRIAGFFKTSQDFGSDAYTQTFEYRIEGVYNAQGGGKLLDSREIDYLKVAATSGRSTINDDLRLILLGMSKNPVDRAQAIQAQTNTFRPVSLTVSALIGNNILSWISRKMGERRVSITDLTSRQTAVPLSSFVGQFGNSASIGSIVSASGGNRNGLGLGGSWNF